jgi:hypothetical protein
MSTLPLALSFAGENVKRGAHVTLVLCSVARFLLQKKMMWWSVRYQKADVVLPKVVAGRAPAKAGRTKKTTPVGRKGTYRGCLAFGF